MPIDGSKLKVKSLKFQRGFSLLFLVAIVAVIGIIVLLFMSFPDLNRSRDISQTENIGDQQVSDLQKLSTSDEIEDIEGDLNSTKLDNLNGEDKQVEQTAKEL